MSSKQRIYKGHRYERTLMVAKCEIFMNLSKIFIGIAKNKYYCQT